MTKRKPDFRIAVFLETFVVLLLAHSTVTEASSRSSEQSPRRERATTDVVIDVPKLAPGEQAVVAELTNNTQETISFHAYMDSRQDRSATQPLSALVQYDWHDPDKGWQRQEIVGYCGTGLSEYNLAPGKSVKLNLYIPDEHQIVRARLSYRIMDGDEERTGHALSDAVRVTPEDKKQAG